MNWRDEDTIVPELRAALWVLAVTLAALAVAAVWAIKSLGVMA